MRLLCQVLAEQFLGVINGLIVTFIDGADDELWSVKICQAAPGLFQAFIEQFHGPIVVVWRHTII
jgi:hypothetical protein